MQRGLGRHDDGAGHPGGGQPANVFQFAGRLVAGLGEHDPETAAPERFAQRVRDRGVQTGADVGDHQPDDVTGRAAHHPRRPARRVAQFGGHLGHPRLGLRTDPGIIGQGPTDRGDGQAEPIGDILGGLHVQINPRPQLVCVLITMC